MRTRAGLTLRFKCSPCRMQLLDRMWDADMGVPRRIRPLADEGSSARQLRTFVDTFVTEDFLPDIYVDFRRALCDHVLIYVPR